MRATIVFITGCVLAINILLVSFSYDTEFEEFMTDMAFFGLHTSVNRFNILAIYLCRQDWIVPANDESHDNDNNDEPSR